MLAELRTGLSRARRRIRVLLLGHWSGRTGASGVYLDLVRALSPAFDVYCLLPGDGPLAERVKPHARELAFLQAPWWLPHFSASLALGLGAATKAVVEKIRSAEIDLVISNTAVIAHGALGAALAGKPHLWYLHELVHRDDDLSPRGIAAEAAHRFIAELSGLPVACSYHVRDEIGHMVPGARIEVLQPYVHAPPLPTYDGGSERADILFCGTLSRRKGCDIALDVLEILSDLEPGARLHFMGLEGALGQRLRAEIGHRNLAARAQIHGLLPDPWLPPWMRPILFHPARSEPFGLTVLEAALRAIPVVAAPCGGPQEILQGIGGCRVSANWRAEEMAGALRQIISDYDGHRQALLASRPALERRFSETRFNLAATLLVVEALRLPPAQLPQGIIRDALGGHAEQALPRNIAQGTREITRHLKITEDQAVQMLEEERSSNGSNVRRDMRRFQAAPFHYSPAMEQVYREGEGFVYELMISSLSWPRRAMAWYAAQRLRELAMEAGKLPGDLRILMFGDGIATDSIRLASLGFRLDYFEPGGSATFRFASARLAERGLLNEPVRVRESIPAEENGRYDALICFEVLEHLPDVTAAIADFARWLRPGGRAFVSEAFEAVRPEYPTHLRENEAWGGWTPFLFVANGFDLLSYSRKPLFKPFEFVKRAPGAPADLRRLRDDPYLRQALAQGLPRGF